MYDLKCPQCGWCGSIDEATKSGPIKCPICGEPGRNLEDEQKEWEPDYLYLSGGKGGRGNFNWNKK